MSLKLFFSGIGCHEGIFTLQIKGGSKSYHALLRHVAYML